MAYEIDTDSLELTLDVDGASMKFALNGVPAESFTRLALIGAAHVLKGRKDPKKAWTKICNNEWGGRDPKRAPLVVKAVAAAKQCPVDQVWKTWESIPKEEKRVILGDPRVKVAMTQLKGGKQADLARYFGEDRSSQS